MKRFIPVGQPSLSQREVDYVNDALSSGWVSSIGRYITDFEQRFAAYCGCRFGLATSNGTTALHLALAAYGIGDGDEVIVPDLTFVATANAVRYTGAHPIMVDIESETLCIAPHSIREAITRRTKAIIPVHLYGHPADTDVINELAAKHGLLVIEDAAEAHGAELQGRRVGSLGNCGIFSFYGNKIITCGEGGMITTNDPAFFERARSLRDHAMSPSRRYWHTEVGFNYRMTNIQAALGLAQLERIGELLEQKTRIFESYKQRLSTFNGIRLNRTASGSRNVYWMVCLELPGLTANQRDDVIAELKAAGVDSRPYFYPISDMPMYQGQRHPTPVAHRVSQIGLNLPSFCGLPDEDVAEICDHVQRILARYGIR